MRKLLLVPFFCLLPLLAHADPAGQAKSGTYKKATNFNGGNRTEGESVSAISYSVESDCERLVFRFNDETGKPSRRVPMFQVVTQAGGKILEVTLLGVSKMATGFPKLGKDGLIANLGTIPSSESSQTKLRIELRRETGLECYEQNYPGRLLLDFQTALKVPFPVKAPAGFKLENTTGPAGQNLSWKKSEGTVHVLLPAGKPTPASLSQAVNNLVKARHWQLVHEKVWKPKWATAAFAFKGKAVSGAIYQGSLGGKPAIVDVSGNPKFLDSVKPMLESF